MTFVLTQSRDLEIEALQTRRDDLEGEWGEVCLQIRDLQRRASDLEHELMAVQQRVADILAGDEIIPELGYCEYCRTEQPPPTRGSPTCSTCEGWLYPDRGI